MVVVVCGWEGGSAAAASTASKYLMNPIIQLYVFSMSVFMYASRLVGVKKLQKAGHSKTLALTVSGSFVSVKKRKKMTKKEKRESKAGDSNQPSPRGSKGKGSRWLPRFGGSKNSSRSSDSMEQSREGGDDDDIGGEDELAQQLQDEKDEKEEEARAAARAAREAEQKKLMAERQRVRELERDWERDIAAAVNETVDAMEADGGSFVEKSVFVVNDPTSKLPEEIWLLPLPDPYPLVVLKVRQCASAVMVARLDGNGDNYYDDTQMHG